MLCEQQNSYHDKTSEETTIERLCNNILLEIFSYLNAKDLKKAVLVCKRWNDVITLSTVTMNKFKFAITNEMLKRRLQNFGSNRNYQNYIIRVEDSTDLTVLAHNITLTNVKSFYIQRTRFCRAISQDIIVIVSKLMALEKLNLCGVRLGEIDESMQLNRMPKLKSFKIYGDDFRILKYIEANELQDFRCTCRTTLEDYKSIANYLVRSTNLKRLTIKGCMDIFEHIDINETKFKLHFFEVYHINANPKNVKVFAENLRKFLLLQAYTLRELKFDFSMYETADGQKFVNNFLQIAFNKCKNLSILDIRNLSLPRNDECYQRLSPNHSIKTLKVHWNFEGEVINGLLRNTPQLEKLRAEYCYLDDNGINTIAALCRKLIHLDTFKLIGILKDDTNFANLKLLDIVKVENNFEPLLSLATKSLAIQQVRIHEYDDFESFPTDFIVQHP